MVFYDKLGRTWNNQKVVWIRVADSSSEALYDCTYRDGKRVLTYDLRHGMFDKDGYYVRDAKIKYVPALESKNVDGTPQLHNWEHFPNTEEASLFKQSITMSGIVKLEKDNYNDDDSDNDDDIMIK